MPAVLVYVTTPDVESARTIGRSVVAEGLAACANILDGMTAIFRWRGAIEESSEAVLLLKTTQDRVDTLTSRLRDLHSYEVPCIVILPITGGNPDFLAWIASETGEAPR